MLEGNLRGVQHLGIPVVNIEDAKAWYAEKLGFEVFHEPSVPTDEGDIKIAFLKLGDLVVEFYQLLGEASEEVKARGHGHIDHFAIDVLDIDSALTDVLARGATLDDSTPDGPVPIPEFWSQGIKYVFLRGPNGEKVELGQRLDLNLSRRSNNLGGWSHLGIPVANIEKSKTFYQQFGFKEVMSAEIPVDGDAIKAAFLEKDGFHLEFYQLLGDGLAEVRTRKDGHIDHIALDVADVDAAFAEIQDAGIVTLEDAPITLPFWEKGARYFNVRGPDGEKVEFDQILG